MLSLIFYLFSFVDGQWINSQFSNPFQLQNQYSQGEQNGYSSPQFNQFQPQFPQYQNTFPVGVQSQSSPQFNQFQMNPMSRSFRSQPSFYPQLNQQTPQMFAIQNHQSTIPSQAIQGVSTFSEGTVYSNDEMPRMLNHDPINGLASNSILPNQPQSTEIRRIVPPFLQGVDKETEDKFYSIVQNREWNGDEKAQKIEEFVRDLDKNRQNTFATFKDQVEDETKRKQKEVHQAVDGMSQEAKIQFQKVSALMTQPGLSDQDRLEKIQLLYKGLSSQIRQEFDTKLASFGRK